MSYFYINFFLIMIFAPISFLWHWLFWRVYSLVGFSLFILLASLGVLDLLLYSLSHSLWILLFSFSKSTPSKPFIIHWVVNGVFFIYVFNFFESVLSPWSPSSFSDLSLFLDLFLLFDSLCKVLSKFFALTATLINSFSSWILLFAQLSYLIVLDSLMPLS